MQKSGNAVFFCGSISLLPDYRLSLSEVCSALPFSRRAVVDASKIVVWLVVAVVVIVVVVVVVVVMTTLCL